MPSNQTPNYQLSQWERSDKIQMEDFNADNAKIDAVLGTLAAQVSTKAEQSALQAEVNARAAAITSLSQSRNCRAVLITYTGTGTFGKDHPVSITFSAMPKVFIIVGEDGAIFCRGGDHFGTAIVHTSRWGSTGASLYTILQWSGNTVKYYGDLPETQLNKQGSTTWIIAFYAQDEE